ncbi:MAG: M23 family metallopeptidase [Muribaculaceae bacterium]|nr:M23 family metallopeptidase [Muribaculaceae bacterium]
MKLFPRIIRHAGALRPADDDTARDMRCRRLDYVNEAAFSRVWSIRFTRGQAIALGALAVAAVAALAYVVMAFTPMRRMLPGTLDADTRAMYIDATLRLDSLTRAMRINERYMADIEAIINGTVNPDSARNSHMALSEMSDTLMAASEAERAFVQKFESSQRYKLSVLAPIAAEGMAFYSPAPGAEAKAAPDERSVELRGTRSQGIDAIYRGTVIAAYIDARGLYTIVMQHPNEFISLYGGLAECFVGRGDTPYTGSRIGAAPPDGTIRFELWHKGNALNPDDYVAF